MIQPGQGRLSICGQAGLGERSQEGGDGVLPAALNIEVLGKRSEETVDTGLQQRGRAVLATQGDGQGVASGGPRGPVGGRLPAGVSRGRDRFTGLGQVACGLVVHSGSPHRRVGSRAALGRYLRWNDGVPRTTGGRLRRFRLSPGLSQGGPGAVLAGLGGAQRAARLLEGGQAGLVAAAGRGDAPTGPGDGLTSL